MLETIVARQVVFYIVGAIAAIGIIAKLVAGISLKRLVRASSNMSKSNHALMRLVRAKFEHACMVSDKVQNVRAFVEKYVFEYRVLGLRLHSWRQLEKATIWIYGIVCAVGAGLEYSVNGVGDILYQYAIVGAAGIVVLFLLHITTDERYQIEAAKMYMVDFLENTYAHRYEKTNQKEIQVTVQRAEGDKAVGQAVAPRKAPVKEPDMQPVTPLEAPGAGSHIAPGESDSEPVQPRPSEEPQPIRTPVQSHQYAGEQIRESSRPYAGGQAQEPSRPYAGGQVQRQAEQQVKVRTQEPLAQAVTNPFVRAAGVPQNASAYEDVGKAQPGVGSASELPVYQTGGTEAQSGYGQMKDEYSGQEFQKEAKIREILEEFLA